MLSIFRYKTKTIKMQNYEDLDLDTKNRILERFISAKEERIKDLDKFLIKNEIRKFHPAYKITFTAEEKETLKQSYLHREKGGATRTMIDLLQAFCPEIYYRKALEELQEIVKKDRESDTVFFMKGNLSYEIKIEKIKTNHLINTFTLSERDIFMLKGSLKEHKLY